MNIQPTLIITSIITSLLLCLSCGLRTANGRLLSSSYNLSVDGYERHYSLFRPEHLNRQSPAPLVIFLHGGFGNGEDAEQAYGWDELAKRSNFVVAYPDGLYRSWNAGGLCCGPSREKNIDDVAFLTQLIDIISKNETIDAKRVYLVGMSNGAALAFRYACEEDYPIAAIGAVSGGLAFSCQPRRAVSLIQIHGMADQHIPFKGGVGPRNINGTEWLAAEEIQARFLRTADCALPVSRRNGPLLSYISSCANQNKIALITIDGAGHQWPGGRGHGFLVTRLLHLDPPSSALDATETIWNFFQNGGI